MSEDDIDQLLRLRLNLIHSSASQHPGLLRLPAGLTPLTPPSDSGSGLTARRRESGEGARKTQSTVCQKNQLREMEELYLACVFKAWAIFSHCVAGLLKKEFRSKIRKFAGFRALRQRII